MKRSKKSDECVYLFTSTIRPQYITDALNVMSSPEGSAFRFRYSRKYVEPNLAKQWESIGKDSLVGKRAIIIFAIQHPNEFYEPSYIPMRDGIITQHFVEGDTFVIYFETKLIRLPKNARSQEIGETVRTYSSGLRSKINLSNPTVRPSALMAPAADELLESLSIGGSLIESQQGNDFQTMVSLMDAALFFNIPKFFRVSKIEKHKLTEGRLEIQAGTRLRISVTHYQMEVLEPGAAIEVTVPNGMTLLSDSTIPLPSKYDVFPIDIFVAYRDDNIEGHLTIASGPCTIGPRVEIPVVVSPSKVPLVAAGSAFAGATASGAGGIIASGAPTKITLVAIGSFLAGVALYLRRSRGLT